MSYGEWLAVPLIATVCSKHLRGVQRRGQERDRLRFISPSLTPAASQQLDQLLDGAVQGLEEGLDLGQLEAGEGDPEVGLPLRD